MARLSDYDYELPESSIAQEPLGDRSASKLMYLHRDSGQIEHRKFSEVPEMLTAGDLLVLNNTRVTARRILGRKSTGAAVELLIIRNLEAGVYEALAKPGRRLQPGAEILLPNGLKCIVEGNLGRGAKRIRFSSTLGLEEAIRGAGTVPLPPYIHYHLANEERYQTVYASAGGSAAAPTAGLHFTPELLAALQRRGINTAQVTLDVGLDTFRPVVVEDLDEHRMHGERCSVPPETVHQIQACKGRIIAVGTTSVRTLESFAIGRRKLESGEQESRLFIRPGYEFQIIDGMFTNFHMPRTTMLLMLAALAGRQNVADAYQVAIKCGYRFLSFGDSMLIM